LSPGLFGYDPWASDLRRVGPFARLRIQALRLLMVITWEFSEHLLSLRATGLVYATLLSLVPFLAVMFSVLKAFGVQNDAEPFLDRFLMPLGPRGAEITRTVVDFVNNVQVGVLGAAGLAGLFITVITLVQKIEDALNHIWRIRHSRSLARKFTDYLSVVLVGPVLVFTAVGLIASAQSYWLVQRVLHLRLVGEILVVVAGRLMPFLFLWAAFTFLYRLVPHTHVPLRSALLGGATAAILWHIAGVGFAAFIGTSASYPAIYSGFAVLVLFLLWLYYAWLVVLVGAEVAYFHQHPAAYLASHRPPSHLYRERMALATMIEVGRRHVAGQPPVELEVLSLGFNAPLAALEELVDELVRRGLLLRAAEPQGIALGRASERISVAEILDVVRGPDIPDQTDFVDQLESGAHVLRLRDQAVQQALGGFTLRSVLAETQRLDGAVLDSAALTHTPEPSHSRA
jgi:membrane protein